MSGKSRSSSKGLVTAALVVSSVLVTGYRIATVGLEDSGDGNNREGDAATLSEGAAREEPQQDKKREEREDEDEEEEAEHVGDYQQAEGQKDQLRQQPPSAQAGAALAVEKDDAKKELGMEEHDAEAANQAAPGADEQQVQQAVTEQQQTASQVLHEVPAPCEQQSEQEDSQGELAVDADNAETASEAKPDVGEQRVQQAVTEQQHAPEVLHEAPARCEQQCEQEDAQGEPAVDAQDQQEVPEQVVATTDQDQQKVTDEQVCEATTKIDESAASASLGQQGEQEDAQGEPGVGAQDQQEVPEQIVTTAGQDEEEAVEEQACEAGPTSDEAGTGATLEQQQQGEQEKAKGEPGAEAQDQQDATEPVVATTGQDQQEASSEHVCGASGALSARRYSEGGVSPGHMAAGGCSASPPSHTAAAKGITVDGASLSSHLAHDSLLRSQSLDPPSCRRSPRELNESVTAVSGMERVSGHLQKQGDLLGLWRKRYFELVSLDAVELEAFASVAAPLKSSGGGGANRRSFFLMYWSCDAEQAQSEQRYRPRGMFVVDGVRMRHESPLTLVLEGLTNAFSPSQAVPSVKLAAAQARGVQKWAAALAFAAVAAALPDASFEGCWPFPLPTLSGTLGRPASALGEASLNCYFRLYRSSGQADSDCRAFLLSWESEQRADARPLRPRNVYELGPGKVTASVALACPTVVVLQGVDDFCFANAQPVSGSKRGRSVFLKAGDPSAAAAWARALVPDASRCNVEQPPAVAFDEGEDFVDEFIPPPSTAAAAAATASRKLASGHAITGGYTDVYTGEEVMDEYVVGDGNSDEGSFGYSPRLSNSSEFSLSLSDVEAGETSDNLAALNSDDDDLRHATRQGLLDQPLSAVAETSEEDEEDQEVVQDELGGKEKELCSSTLGDLEDTENAGAAVANDLGANDVYYSKGNSYQAHLAKRGLLNVNVNAEQVPAVAHIPNHGFAPLSPVREEGEEGLTSRRSSIGSVATD